MLYRYEAIEKASGRSQEGTTEAASPAEARALLRSKGLFASSVAEAIHHGNGHAKKGSRGISWLSFSGRKLDALTQSTRHLALLLKTGLPLADSLQVLSGQIQDRSFRYAVENVASRVREGVAFDEALGRHPEYFPELYVHVARAGVQAGELAKVLIELAAYYARQKKIRDRVVSALTYPALMCGVGVLVLVFLLTYVVPKVTTVLLEEGSALPWPTEVLLVTSAVVSEWWWIVLPGLLAFGLIVSRLLRTQAGGRLKDRAMIALPVIGDLFRKQIVARWAGTMSTLLKTGIPIADALAVVRGTSGSMALADDVERIERDVVEGRSLSDSLKKSRIFPPSLGFVAGVGEESGELDQVLREVADSYNEEVDVSAGRLTELLNPVLIVFLGLVVGFIVAGILLPITDFSRIQ